MPLFVALLGGCATVPPIDTAERDGRIVSAPLPLAGAELVATWYVPSGEPQALVLLQHGFARQCATLHETSRRLMQASLMVLCIDAPMAAGNPQLAEVLAQGLAAGAVNPPQHALPAPVIVGGHSAGAAFAVGVGTRLEVLAPQRLAGALLFDPVATGGFPEQLLRVSDAGRRPVLALLAPAHGCNAQANALPALREVRRAALAAGRNGFVGVQFAADGTHVDVEGEDGDWIGRAACGAPMPANVEALRGMAVRWAAAMAAGRAPEPLQGQGWHAIE
jgi:hypothetical protein